MGVTIGIPFYNSATTLADTIRSVFAQTYADWELILVDDGSDDGSLEIASMVSHPSVRVVSDGRRLGLAARLNEIAEAASGEYIARMDADDIMHPSRLERQVRYLDTNVAVDVVGSAAYAIDGCNRVTGVRSLTLLDTSARAVMTRGLFIHPSVMGRAEWFRRNPYNPSFLGSEDVELWCRTVRSSRFGKIVAPLLYYRENGRPPREYLSHYLKAAHYLRRVYRAQGPSLIGRAGALTLIARSYAKANTYRLCTVLGLQHLLVRARNLQLDLEESANAEAELAQALAAEVPGFPESTHRLLEAA